MHARTLALFLVLALAGSALAADAKGWFGFDAKAEIQGEPSPDPMLASLQVESVAPASPAAKAGLAAGDQIVAIQGTTVNGTHATAVRTVMQKAVGESINLTIKRGTAAPRVVTLTAVPKQGNE